MRSLARTGFLSLMALTACAPMPEPREAPLKGTVTIAAGPCLGFCPVYTMTLAPDEYYVLQAGANTVNPGTSRGAVPVGSFRKALEAMDYYGFEDMQTDYTPSSPQNCPQQVTDTPTIRIGRQVDGYSKTITYYTGCLGFADKDRLDQLSARLRQIFRVDARVSVGEVPKEEPAEE